MNQAHGTGQAVIWTNAGGVGSQRFPIHGSGDCVTHFEDLACLLRAVLSFGMSGFPFYGLDVGAIDRPDSELFIRWAQFGLFGSHVRAHNLPSPPASQPGNGQAEAIFRKYADLRYRLMPYIYTEAVECGRSSLPLLRALALEYQTDQTALMIEDEYMFGRSLLSAPVLDETNRRHVYLPPVSGSIIGRNSQFTADVGSR
jgi:alpha-D-xyloside xylohydrolase